jgi:hypothetical protein
MSSQDAEHEIRNRRIGRNLMDKTKLQLQFCQPGILVIDGSKAALFHFSVKEIAERLLPKRPQVALIMLWSLERGSQIGEPPFCFANSGSPFLDLTRRLLRHLGRLDLMSI